MSIRVGGLATGLDTKALIGQLMQSERKPIIRIQTRTQQLQANQTLWKNVGQALTNMDRILANLAKPEEYSKLQASSSNKDVLSASIGDNAIKGTWQVQVYRLAESRIVASQAFTSVGPGEFTLNGATFNLTEATDVRGLAAVINKGGESKFTVSEVDTAGEMAVTGTYGGGVDGVLRIEVEGQDLHVFRNDELVETFTGALNHEGDGAIELDGLKMSFSEVSTGDSMAITVTGPKDSGVTASVVNGLLVLKGATNNPIEYSDPQRLLEDIGLLDADGNEQQILVEGSTAVFNVNGLLLERDSNTIEDVLPGVRFVLNEAGGKKADISVSDDHKTITDNLNQFVEVYNGLLRALGSQSSLASDTTARRLNHVLQRTVMDIGNPGGTLTSLRELGIASPDRSGALAINMDKLTEAFKDPAAVRELLLGDTGLISNVRSAVMQWSDSQGIIKDRLDSFKSQIDYNETSIRMAEGRLERKEAQLWRRYVAMEKAISTMNNQGNWMAGQLNSLPGYRNER